MWIHAPNHRRWNDLNNAHSPTITISNNTIAHRQQTPTTSLFQSKGDSVYFAAQNPRSWTLSARSYPLHSVCLNSSSRFPCRLANHFNHHCCHCCSIRRDRICHKVGCSIRRAINIFVTKAWPRQRPRHQLLRIRKKQFHIRFELFRISSR